MRPTLPYASYIASAADVLIWKVILMPGGQNHLR